MHPMDGVFSLSEAARTNFLRTLVQFCGCTYICLWRYDHSPLSNYLFFLDGFYNVTNNQPSFSSGISSSVAERLFNQYQLLAFDVNDNLVPGLAFRNHHPYLELQQLDLLRLVSTEIQLQFFQEARIKIAIFMGCNKGEIELGFSNMPQVDIQATLRSLFPEEFFRQSQTIDQNPQCSSSSSSIISLSGSTECSSLLLSNSNITGTSSSMSPFPETVPTMQPVPATRTNPYQQVIPNHFPTPEGEHDAIITAILHVISSSSTFYQQQQQQNFPYTSSVVHTAFKKYRADDIGLNIRSNLHRQSMLKRSFAFCRSLNLMRMRERIQAASRPARTQLHHRISERRRRDKQKEKFQTLGALLPLGTKKDKSSILTTAKETLRSLMARVEKLNMSNQQLMTTLMSAKEASNITSKSSNERLNVRVSNVPQPSSEERMVELQVTVRGESSQVDILIRLLEFFKLVQNVSLISMGSNAYVTEGTTINQLTFRLRIIEGSEWDESAFQEAVRRLVADLVH